ncbi:TRAP transporter small permease [Geminicoccaceae bacterium 1502E]|nr:TRAP transporter small permease [Geminicoccaceae bacterium 1502E]
MTPAGNGVLARASVYLRPVCDWAACLTRASLVGLVGLIVAVVALQVVRRYFFNAALVWPEEAARICFIWMSFLGVPLLLRRHELLSVDILGEILPACARRWLQRLMLLAAAPFFLVMTRQGIAMMGVVEGQVIPALGLPSALVYLAVPVGSLLALLFTIERLLAEPEAVSAP